MSNFDVNRRAKLSVVDEIRRRGGVILSGGTRFEPVRATNNTHSRTVAIEVHAKTRGDWQTQITKGAPRSRPPDETEFWVLVDFSQPAPSFYVFEKWWIQNDIHSEHEVWLASMGGERPVNPASIHHAIRVARPPIAEARDRWDRLRLF